MGFVLLLYALFASVFTIAKTGLEFSQPFFFVGTRMALAGVILLSYYYWKNGSHISLKTLRWWKIIRLAAFNIYLTNVFEFWGLKYLTSFKACLIYSLSPFVSALLSYFIFSERITWRKWLGLGVGCLGLMPVLLNITSQEERSGHFFFLSGAELAVILAAICSVYGWILLRQLVKDEGYSPILANGLSMLIGGIMSLTHSRLVENWDPLPVTHYVPFLECSILLIVISNLICYNLYGTLLKKYSATFMSFAGFTTPFFTALFGWAYLGEVVAWPFYLSTLILFLGLLLFYQEELQRETAISTLPTPVEGN
ncbi:MAG: EamA family transporter [Parachlamydiaceae bacterium]|nr:EamA family transporter [Parachlamydiaceae bacterium]